MQIAVLERGAQACPTSNSEVTMPQPFSYFVDLIGGDRGCNLRCPSCAVGNVVNGNRKPGLMSVAQFEAILDKIGRDVTDRPVEVHLYSWTEPLLHKQIGQIIAAVKARGYLCSISSNLNDIRNLDEAIAARPDWMRISLSGFTQEVYGQTHVGGDVEVVKQNMRRLREILDAHNSQTQIFVGFHRYRHNAHELKPMSDLAAELGYQVAPVFAYLMPLDGLIDYYEGNPIPEKAQSIIPLLAISPDEQKAIQQKTPPQECPLRTDQMMINADGSVQLCCAVFDSKFVIAQSYLDASFDELQATKMNHSFCETCMSHEGHKISIMAHPERLDEVGFRNIGQASPVQVASRRVKRVASELAQSGPLLAVRSHLKVGTHLRNLRRALRRRTA